MQEKLRKMQKDTMNSPSYDAGMKLITVNTTKIYWGMFEDQTYCYVYIYKNILRIK